MVTYMRLLLLDFETVDESISLGLGAGWAFAANNLDTVRFEVVGWSTAILDTDTMTFSEPNYFQARTGALQVTPHIGSQSELSNLINKTDGIIAHNTTYELGCLKVLGIDFLKTKKIFDTKIMAQLYFNEVEHLAGRSAFSLENLSEVYLPKEQRKAIDLLIDAAIQNKLVEEPRRKGYNIERFRDKVQKWCYSNMDKLPSNVIGEYCNRDLVATGNLFIKFIDKAPHLAQVLNSALTNQRVRDGIYLNSIVHPEPNRLNEIFTCSSDSLESFKGDE